jgi:hypothetical protein
VTPLLSVIVTGTPIADRALRRICGPKRDEVTGGWRKLHNEELHNFVLFSKYN